MTQTHKRFGAGRSFLAAAALGIGLAAASGTASADYVTATFKSTYGGTIYIQDSSSSSGWKHVNAGLFELERTDGDYSETLLPDLSGTFYALCIETQQTITQGSYEFQIDDLQNASGTQAMGAQRAGFISQLLYGVQPIVADKSSADNGFTKMEAMALQLAVWEILNETAVTLTDPDFDVGAGNTLFQTESLPGAMALANTWLQQFVNGTEPRDGVNNVIALRNDSNQDLLALFYFEDDGSGHNVPAPGTLALLGLGLAGLAGTLRRRR